MQKYFPVTHRLTPHCFHAGFTYTAFTQHTNLKPHDYSPDDFTLAATTRAFWAITRAKNAQRAQKPSKVTNESAAPVTLSV